MKNPPPALIRWSIARISLEFRIGVNAVRRRLSDAHMEPEEDGFYSGWRVRELLEKGSPIAAARLHKMEAETALAQAKTAIIEREFLRKDKLALALASTYGHMRRVVDRSTLPPASKVALLKLFGAGPEALIAGEAEVEESDLEECPKPDRRSRKRRTTPRRDQMRNGAS